MWLLVLGCQWTRRRTFRTRQPWAQAWLLGNVLEWMEGVIEVLSMQVSTSVGWAGAGLRKDHNWS